MARPERNNVDYFPFFCEEGKKMFYIEETYGNDGFAVFVKLLRELAKADYHYLDLSKKTTQMFLAAKCKVDKTILLSIIKDLVELEKFDKKLWEENSIIWCQDFIDSIQDAYKKRNNDCITYDSLLKLLEGLGIRKQSKCKSKGDVNPQSKVEYSKVEETKENNSSVKNEFLREREILSNVRDYFDVDIIRNLSKSEAQKWIETIDKLHRIDGYDFEIIEKVIIWGRQDSFWRANLQSIPPLRKKNKGDSVTKFQKILKKMQYGNQKSNERNQKRADLARNIATDIATDPDFENGFYHPANKE
jgi:hypothetical protein